MTIVGTELFVGRINSHAHDGTELDWRRRQDSVPLATGAVPDEVGAALLRTCSTLGLTFGAADLIVTPAGEHLFSRSTRVVAWLFAERAADLRITRSLAALLAAGE